jgi:hypothetical protein
LFRKKRVINFVRKKRALRKQSHDLFVRKELQFCP